MCGIVAYVGSKLGNELALKLLGNANTSRGKNAFGICVNDDIFKKTCSIFNPNINSVNTFKNFYEDKLIFKRTNNDNVIKMKNKTVLIHTRSKSSGANTVENAHPFSLPTDKEGVNLIGVHNGTISNCYTLAKEYNIEDWSDQYRVDSNFILSFLAKGDYSILEKYEGNANFVWYTTDKPNTLNVWRGGTINAQGVLEPERPLYYAFDKSSNGFYISSLDEPLNGVTTGKVIEFPMNKITKFEGNQVIEEITIDRKIKVPVIKQPNYFSSEPSYNSKSNSRVSNTSNNTKTIYVKDPEGLTEPLNLDELIDNKDLIYYYEGRYKRDAKLAEGSLYLDDDGNITDSKSGKLCYFWEGFWVTKENFNLLNKTLNGENYSPYVLSAESQVKHLLKTSNGWWVTEGIKTTASNLKPKFSFFKYTIIKGEITAIAAITSKIKPFIKDECVINFNLAYSYLGVFATWEQCEVAFAKENPNSPNIDKDCFSNVNMGI